MKTKISPLIITLFLTIINVSFSFSQTYTFDADRNWSSNSGNIVDGNIIKGYYFFNRLEKVSKKQAVYEIIILDDNLKELATQKITEARTLFMVESSYNGDNILFKFFDSKAKTVSYRTMNPNGKLSQKETRDANKYELASLSNSVTNNLKNTNLNSIDKNLFIDVYTYKDKKYKYQVTGVNTNGQIAWEYKPADQKKGIVGGTFLASNKDQVLIMEARSKSLMSRDYTFNGVVLDKSGEMLHNVDLSSTKYNMMPINASVDPKTQNFIVMGEYFDVKDKAMKSESKGLFVKVIDEEGDEVNETFLSWSRHLGPKVDPEHKKDLRKYGVYFHNVFMTSEGEIVAIGEQFRKQVSAGGIAMNLAASALSGVSSNAAVLEIELGNLLVINLTKDFDVKSVNVLEKRKHSVILPEGYGMVNKNLLARVLAAEGSFDYYYTQSNEDYSNVSVAYVDKEKVKGKLSRQFVLRFENFVAGESETSQDKIELESDDSVISAGPAKPGHVLIFEYFSRDRTVELRLEPLNF